MCAWASPVVLICLAAPERKGLISLTDHSPPWREDKAGAQGRNLEVGTDADECGLLAPLPSLLNCL